LHGNDEMKKTLHFVLAAGVGTIALAGDPVAHRGIFINDEDWSLRPWAIRHFGAEEGIGTNAYAEVYALMKKNGLNLIWPAMHEKGYEFTSRPENMAQAAEWGITVGTSHCEPMLRNNCYLSNEDKKKWDWTLHKDFITDYWREAAEKFATNDVMWTIGIRGVHDGRMRGGKNTAERIAILEDVFAVQEAMLPYGAPKVFCPYKEVLPIYNAGLKVPDDATILWVNDNYGYVRRLGGPQCAGRKQGMYYHVAYWYYLQCITTPPALMWYELVAKCSQNGVRDLWMLNVGDVFNAEILIYCYGRFAADPDYWATRPNAQSEVLGDWVDENLSVLAPLKRRIVAHLNEYYNLGFIRKPEHMCKEWVEKLPSGVKKELRRRYAALLAEDLAIEKELSEGKRDTYFRAVGFQAQFLAHAGMIFIDGRDKDCAASVLDPLNKRYDEIEGGKWSGFAVDTVRDNSPIGRREESLAAMHMQWPWNDGRNARNDARRGKLNPTAYRPDEKARRWLEPIATIPANGGAWTIVSGLGTSGKALVLLPVKPGVGAGAKIEYALKCCGNIGNTLILRFLPDFSLWPGMKLRVKVAFDNAPPQIVEVPLSNANISEAESERLKLTQDNFAEVRVQIPAGADSVSITAIDPGAVLDAVGVE